MTRVFTIMILKFTENIRSLYQLVSIVSLTVLWVCLSSVGMSQSGGAYELTQSVIANGGGANSGGVYGLDGTTGQAAAGTQSNGLTFVVTGGFWQAFFSSTAAMVSVTGRLTTSDGQPVRLARVVLTDGRGNIRLALTSDFGYFRFDNIEVGQTYI